MSSQATYRCTKLTTDPKEYSIGPTAELESSEGALILIGTPVWNMEQGKSYRINIDEVVPEKPD